MIEIFHLLFLVLLDLVQPWPLNDTFSVWIWRSSVVAGKYLYIDGGEWYTNDDDGPPTVEELSSTYAIDLSTSWTTDSVNALINSRPQTMSTVRKPSMWYDAERNYVYEWGGWPYDDNRNNLLWSFQPDGKGGAVWSQNPPPVSQRKILNAPVGASWASSPAAFYSLGGALVPPLASAAPYFDPNTTISGLVSYNLSTNVWSNVSSAEFSNGGYTAFGEGRYVSNFGSKGLLVFFGGSTPSNQTFKLNEDSTLASLKTIPLYDLQNDKWYHQNATGDIPPKRSSFCSVGIAAPDNSSYEIFIYGGYSFPSKDETINDEDYEDVFILSLPAFRWFRASSTSSKRTWHFCDLIGKRHMVVIGGADPDIELGTSPDPWTHGIGIFDMTELSWSNSFNASAEPYEQPSVIKQFYAVNPHQPSAWNDRALADVFAINTTKSRVNTTREGSQASEVSTASTKHHRNIGALVGGTVGGFAGFCIVTGLVLYFSLRKRQKQRICQSQSTVELDQRPPPQEMSIDSSYGLMPQLGSGGAWELDGNERKELDGNQRKELDGNVRGECDGTRREYM